MKRIARLLFATAAIALLPVTARADFGHSHHDRDESCDRGSYSGGYSNWGHSGWNHGYRPSYQSYNNGYNSYGNNYGGGYSNVIRSGIRSGDLSPREVRELRDSERDIQRRKVAYLRDGRLSKDEREDLRDEYRDFRHDLNHELNDGERRW